MLFYFSQKEKIFVIFFSARGNSLDILLAKFSFFSIHQILIWQFYTVKCIVVTKIFWCVLYNFVCPTEHFLFWVCHNHDLSSPCLVTTITCHFLDLDDFLVMVSFLPFLFCFVLSALACFWSEVIRYNSFTSFYSKSRERSKENNASKQIKTKTKADRLTQSCIARLPPGGLILSISPWADRGWPWSKHSRRQKERE